MPTTPQMRAASQKHQKNILKRGQVPKTQVRVRGRALQASKQRPVAFPLRVSCRPHPLRSSSLHPPPLCISPPPLPPAARCPLPEQKPQTEGYPVGPIVIAILVFIIFGSCELRRAARRVDGAAGAAAAAPRSHTVSIHCICARHAVAARAVEGRPPPPQNMPR